MCKCPGSGIRRAWQSHKQGRALGDVEGVRRPGGRGALGALRDSREETRLQLRHALHKHQEPAGSGEVYTVCTGKQPHGGDGTRPSPPSCPSRPCCRALPRGPGVPQATALGHCQEMPNTPQLPSRGRACSLGLQEGWRRAPCAPQGRTSPVVAGSRHPLPSPRSPAPAAITCANTRAAPRDQRAAALHSSSRKSSLLGQRNFK